MTPLQLKHKLELYV